MARSIEIEWTQDALADLGRFAAFLEKNFPHLAPMVAQEIVDKVRMLEAFPRLGRPIAGREEYRQLVLQVLNASYVFQYRYDGRCCASSTAERSMTEPGQLR